MNYDEIKAHISSRRKLQENTIDEFILYYGDEKNRLSAEFDAKLFPFKHIAKKIPVEFINRLRAAYMAHQIFKKGGHIHKYINQNAIKNLQIEKQNHLAFYIEHPWKFVFSVIIDNPATDFYVMENAFTNERHLLYSPGMTQTMVSYTPQLWLLLTAYNGQCWETYGPIIGLKGFHPDDIYFFATEVNPKIEDENDLVGYLQQHPLPFLMLMAYSDVPVVVHSNHQFEYNVSHESITEYNIDALSHSFELTNKNGVYKLVLPSCHQFPHFAAGYLDTNTNSLFRMSHTAFGFEQISQALIASGFPLDEDADIRLSIGMKIAASEILKRDIEFNPFAHLFNDPEEDEADDENEETVKKINDFIKILLPYINTNKEPDLKKLAENSGISLSKATALYQLIQNKRNSL